MEQKAPVMHLYSVSGYEREDADHEQPKGTGLYQCGTGQVSPAVSHIAMGYLHSAQDAEDAVSDAIESAWKNLKRIRSNDAIPAYLIRCTINSAKTELRRKRHTEPLEPYQESLVAHDPGNPISDYFSALQEKDQLLLILKYQENLREAEIASILHLPRGTISSRLSRLLDRLREEMKKEESENA